MGAFDRMWMAYPGFRRSMSQMSIAWAVVFGVQATVTAIIIASTRFDTAYTFDQILPFVALVVAIKLTVTIGRRAQRTDQAPRALVADPSACRGVKLYPSRNRIDDRPGI